MYAGQLADTGKVDEGIALANAQLNKTPEDRDTYLALAQIDIRLKRFTDAAGKLDKAEALTTKPDERLNIDFVRGTMYDRQKMYDQAEASFRKALATDPQNPTVLNYLGYMLADRGVRLPEATAMIRKAVDLDPQNYAFLDSLGWVYYKSGQYALAEQFLRQAIERSSSDPTVHDHLGRGLRKNRQAQARGRTVGALHDRVRALAAGRCRPRRRGQGAAQAAERPRQARQGSSGS